MTSAANPQDAVKRIVDESVRRWHAEEEVVDDVTHTTRAHAIVHACYEFVCMCVCDGVDRSLLCWCTFNLFRSLIHVTCTVLDNTSTLIFHI